MNELGTPRDLSVQGLSKSYGSAVAVADVDLEVRAGEFMTLLGPSGSGKTTTLKLVAGFESPDAGSVLIGDKDVVHLPPHRRGLGVVFQSYALFPHMSVAQNVAYGLKQLRLSRGDRDRRVGEALEIVRMGSMASRRPSELSGGQQQRAALARAIAHKPPILLMDEPLGALDRRLRDSMQLEIRRIHRELGSTVVFVTHDQEEALSMSDRIAVFDNGTIQQVGTAEDLYERPRSLFVSEFLGESVQFAGSVTTTRGSNQLGVEGVTLTCPQWTGPAAATGTLVIRPERVTLQPKDAVRAPGENLLPGVVREVVYLGSARRVVVGVPGERDVIVREQVSDESRRAGDLVDLRWSVDHSILLPSA